MQKLLTCFLGGVCVEVSVPEEFHDGLVPFQRRMNPFKGDAPIDLRMFILTPKTQTNPRNSDDKKAQTNNYVLNMVQKRAITKSNELLKEITQHLKPLLSDPAIHDVLKRFVCNNGQFSVTPFEAGFMFANLSIGEAVLLLDKKWFAKSSFVTASWWPVVNITAVNAVMALLAICLAEHGDGIIVHGTGVSFQGKGYLFLAPSGGGKTTISIHSPAGSVLADDGIIIRKTRNLYHLYPTPFRQRPGGKIKMWVWRQIPVVLQAVFILDKGPQTRIKPISRPKVMGFLVNGLTHFFKWMQPTQATQTFDFWLRLSKTIPIAGLEWRIKSDFWPAIHKFIIKGNDYEIQEEIPYLAS